MSTKLYLHSLPAPYVPATNRGTWNLVYSGGSGYHLANLISTEKFTQGDSLVQRGLAENSATNPYNMLLYKGVSQPLDAQTIDGTFNVVIGVSESNIAADFHWHIHAYVTIGDSDTVRGTLLNDYTEALGVNEFPTTLTAIALTSDQALSSVVATAGDRLVVEIGVVSRNASTTSRTASLYTGSSATDLVLGDTGGTLGARSPYLIFSDDIAFTTIPAPSNDDCASATNIASLPYSVTLDTYNATPTAYPNAVDPIPFWVNGGANGMLRTVWWKFTAPSDMELVATSGVGYNSAISVWTGSCGSFTEVVSIDAQATFTSTPTESLRWSAQSGVTYHVMVSAYGPGGILTFTLNENPAGTPINQHFTQALEIGTAPYTIIQDSSLADDSSYLWYSYTAQPGDEMMSIMHKSSGGNTQLRVFAPDALVDGYTTPAEYLYTTHGYETPVQFPVVAGETYLVRLSHFGIGGTTELRVNRFTQQTAAAGCIVFPGWYQADGTDATHNNLYRGYPHVAIDMAQEAIVEYIPTGDPNLGLPGSDDGACTSDDGTICIATYDPVDGYGFWLYNPDRTFKAKLLVDWWGYHPSVVAIGNNFYSLKSDTGGVDFLLRKFSSDGVLLDTWTIPNAAGGFGRFAISADETWYYGDDNSPSTDLVCRYNLVTETLAAAVQPVMSGWGVVDIRAQSDNTVVALFSGSGSNERIRHYTYDGTLLSSVDLDAGPFGSYNSYLLSPYDKNAEHIVYISTDYDSGVWTIRTVRLADGVVTHEFNVAAAEEASVGEGKWWDTGTYDFTDPQFGSSYYFYQPFWMSASAVATVPPLQRAGYLLFSNSIVEKQVETRLTKSYLSILAADPPAAGGAPVVLSLTQITGNLYNQDGVAITTGRLLITPREAITIADQLVSTVTVSYTITGALDLNLASSGGVLYDVQYDPDPSDTVTPVNLKSGFFKTKWDVPNVPSIDVADL